MVRGFGSGVIQGTSTNAPCIHPDTLILMADGSRKAVKEIEKGELIQTPYGTSIVDERIDFVATKSHNRP